MSEATKAKSAKARATIAARKIKRQQEFGRSFDDCFEMNDGDDVLRELIRKADADPELKDAIREKGFGIWLEPEYRARYGVPEQPILPRLWREKVLLTNLQTVGAVSGCGFGWTRDEAIEDALRIARERDQNAYYDPQTGSVCFAGGINC